ncbi:oligosaccharide flippase family protein [uncultured Maribacter sp.]|uniref:oligosaccharide flippase family protein n=1 Tax=uncultured Maribacter sp. TaxID=431308 RepID=UPI0030EEAD83
MKEKQESSNTIQAFWMLIGSFSSLALAIFSAAILSRYLDKFEYGTYRQILYVYTTLSILFSAGLPRVFSYFLPRYPISEGKSIVWKVTTVLFLAGFLFSLCLFFGSGLIANALNNKELETGLKTFAIIPTLLLPTLGIEGIFSTYKKTIYIAIYNTLSKLLTLGFIVLPVVWLNGTYITALYGWIMVSFISLIIALFFKNIPFKKIKPIKTGLSYKEIFSYSLPLVIASFWGLLISAADQFYISRFFGAEVFAEFANGFTEVPFVGMVTVSAATVVMPIFSKMIHDQTSTSNLIRMWTSVLTKSALIIYPIVIFFLFFSKEIMVLLYSEKYTTSATYFKIFIVYNLFNIIVFAPLMLSMGRTKLYANVHMFLAVASWVLGFIIINTFNSPVAIAVLSVTLRIAKVLIFTYLIAKLLKIKVLDLYPIKSLLLIIVHGLFTGALVWLAFTYVITINNMFIQLGISFVVYTLILLVTARIADIDYLIVLKPILIKFREKFFKT